MSTAPSGRLYSVVTKFWPRIAAGFIATLGLVELVLGGLTSDSSVELYLTAWAATTGGVWFFFEKAEQALGEESRGKVVSWVGGTDLTAGIESIPEQFRSLFDRAFGERQLTLKCFLRSGVASVVAVLAVAGFFMVVLVPDQFDLYLGSGDAPVRLSHSVDWLALPRQGGVALVEVLFWAMMFNLIPDFVSLWETRVVTKWASAKRRSLGTLLLADLGFTSFVSGASVVVVLTLVSIGTGLSGQLRWDDVAAAVRGVVTLAPNGLGEVPTKIGAERPPDLQLDVADIAAYQDQWAMDFEAGSVPFFHLWPNMYPNPNDPGSVVRMVHAGEFDRVTSTEYLPLGMYFYSAFATSVWLWLHAAAVLLSRFLLRMNSGVGFLLRVTDVERQPFRSMGFVSVIIVSALFALGLPLVLL